MDYERLKVALLERYDFTERGYREKFREVRPEGHESLSQFIFRLKNYFRHSCFFLSIASQKTMDLFRNEI